jgi:hypothetical protein
MLATSIAIRDINVAVGRPGGVFDRLLRTIEKVATKQPAAQTQDPEPPQVEEEPPKRKAQKKAGTKRTRAKAKPKRREQEASKT